MHRQRDRSQDRSLNYDGNPQNMQAIMENFKAMQMLQQQANQMEIISQGGEPIGKGMKQRQPNDPALSIKDSSILSSEDSIMQRRKLRENLEREFGLGNDYKQYPRGNYGPDGFYNP